MRNEIDLANEMALDRPSLKVCFLRWGGMSAQSSLPLRPHPVANAAAGCDHLETAEPGCTYQQRGDYVDSGDSIQARQDQEGSRTPTIGYRARATPVPHPPPPGPLAHGRSASLAHAAAHVGYSSRADGPGGESVQRAILLLTCQHTNTDSCSPALPMLSRPHTPPGFSAYEGWQAPGHRV